MIDECWWKMKAEFLSVLCVVIWIALAVIGWSAIDAVDPADLKVQCACRGVLQETAEHP